MSKVKLLSILCGGLLIINLGLIWFLVSHKPSRPRGEGPKKMIIKKLNFDENQIIAYDKLIDWHRSEIRKSDKKMLELKNQLYSTLLADTALNIKDSIIKEIGNLQMSVEQIHYKHFRDIRQLCKPGQLNAFEEFSLEITDLFPSTRNKQH